MRTRASALALAAVAVLLLVSPVGAQEMIDKLKNTTPQQRATLQNALMKEKLGLTDAEEPKIAAINLKYAEKMEPVIKGDLGMFARVREMRQINQAKEAELQQALTPPQFQKYLAAKDEIRQKFEEKISEKQSQ